MQGAGIGPDAHNGANWSPVFRGMQSPDTHITQHAAAQRLRNLLNPRAALTGTSHFLAQTTSGTLQITSRINATYSTCQGHRHRAEHTKQADARAPGRT